MKLYNYSEARQNFTSVLNTALREEVIITRKDGSKFKILSIETEKTKGHSPLENIKWK
jgi:PHD/YefM family antitoxin component YafN of YafNO toxin-antitoxin module